MIYEFPCADVVWIKAKQHVSKWTLSLDCPSLSHWLQHADANVAAFVVKVMTVMEINHIFLSGSKGHQQKFG